MGDNLVPICSQAIWPLPCRPRDRSCRRRWCAGCKNELSAAALAIICCWPGIDEIKTKSLEVADIVGRKLKSVRDCDAGSLQISQLSGNLMDSQSRSAPCGRF